MGSHVAQVQGDINVQCPGFPSCSNLGTLSSSFAVICSWVMIQDVLRFVATDETVFFFHALAIVSFAPRSIKNIRFWVCLGVLSILWFSNAIVGFWGIPIPVTFRTRWNNLFQKPLMRGQVHQVWCIVPTCLHPLKHRRRHLGRF